MTIIAGREVSSCLLSSSYLAAKIAIFDDLELSQELRCRTVPERAILAEIMYGLERNHFALVLPGNSNLTNDQTLNLPGDWFPLMSSSEDLRFNDLPS